MLNKKLSKIALKTKKLILILKLILISKNAEKCWNVYVKHNVLFLSRLKKKILFKLLKKLNKNARIEKKKLKKKKNIQNLLSKKKKS